ncbi:MAG: TRAP transporter substrate-binding protein [Syntrophorhabdaceae bacterium]|nr:TRAP transporter substrate-binding protein [Syntrophorhabdaceae bacterium]MDD5244605.1 TRAP transporter substrate-binding protein [Syntrophorhabdaceae bacterium]
MRRKSFFYGIGGIIVMLAFIAAAFVTAWPVSAAEKPIELSLNHLFPEVSWFHKNAVIPWKNMVEQKSKGRLKINVYPSGALAKAGTMYDALKAGTIDIAWDPGPYYIGRFPMSEATQLPFLGAQSSWAASRAWMDLYYAFPELRKEYADVKLLWLFSQGPAQLITRKPVRKLEDMKGLIVRAPGGMGDYIKALGGSPVSIPAPESYLALSKGTIDATVFPGEAIPTWKLHEVTKYVNMSNIAVQWFWAAMNKDKYNSLPKDLQKVIDECSGTVGADIVGKAWNDADKAGFELAKQKGMEFIYLTPDEEKRWEQQVSPVTDKWIKTMEAKGYPAKKFVDAAKKSIAKYNKQLAGTNK